jgi:hypothetical protein
MFCKLAVLLSAHACQQITPLSPLMESLSVITQFSFALWHNKMAAPLSVCNKEEQRAVICFLWSEGVPGTGQHNMGAVFYRGEVYTNGWRNSNTVGQAWRTRKEQERGATVNSVRYSETLSTKLKPAIRTKRRGLFSRSVLLLHDNARPYTVIHTTQSLVKLGFECWTIPHTVLISLPRTAIFWST